MLKKIMYCFSAFVFALLGVSRVGKSAADWGGFGALLDSQFELAKLFINQRRKDHPKKATQGRACHVVQSTSSPSIFGFKTRSKKANWNSRRLGLTSIHQMFSQNMFQLQFWVSIFLV